MGRLLAPAERQDSFYRDTDYRRSCKRCHSAASIFADGGRQERCPHIYKQPRRFAYGGHGNLRHNEFSALRCSDILRWAGGEHGNNIACGRNKGQEVFASELEGYDTPALWRSHWASEGRFDSGKRNSEVES